METFDLVVIGAGPGGYPAAIRAAQLGASVAVVEREHPGGTCLNCGCIPSKALIHASDLYWRIKSSEVCGLSAEALSYDYSQIARHKDEVVLMLRNSVQKLLEANGVKIYSGTAGFESRNRLAVENSGIVSAVVKAGKIIIATGATAAMPAHLPRHERVVDSRAFLSLESIPPHVMVLGGGIIGCELACMLAQFDVRVTIVELMEDILMMLDADVRRVVRRGMEKSLGVRILTGKPLENVVADDRGVRGAAGGETVEADLLLVATGRTPVTSELHLENAGLTVNERGFIDVDEYGRTAVPGVFAIGDVAGGPQLAHAATSQGIIAAENACGQRLRKNEKCIPYCIFTSPEAGVVGLSEQAARQQGVEIRTGRCDFAALGKGLAIGKPAGFAKWIADARTGQLLGAEVAGPHATELIAEATGAIRGELTSAELARTIHAHPTLSEAWMEAAAALTGEAIHSMPRGPAQAARSQRV